MRNQVGVFMVLATLFKIQVQTTEYNEPIISGSEAALGQFPWQVILKRHKLDDLLCGGSLISDSWVLTAAHCVNNRTSILLVFGTIELDNMDINMTSTTFYMHPQYNGSGFTYDIALIQLPTAISFTDNVKAIPLVTSTEAANDFVGVQATIMGFGQTSDQSANSSTVLLWAHVEIISNSECSKAFTEPAQDEAICAKGENEPNTSTCKGDSGGPLVWKNEADNFVQIGVTTFYAIEGCTKNYPSGFARVSAHLNFIKNITRIAFD